MPEIGRSGGTLSSGIENAGSTIVLAQPGASNASLFPFRERIRTE